MRWIDLSDDGIRIAIVEDLFGTPHLAALGARPKRALASALEAAGFRKSQHGDWVRLMMAVEMTSIGEALSVIKSRIPSAQWNEDARIGDVYPQLHDRWQNGSTTELENELHDRISAFKPGARADGPAPEKAESERSADLQPDGRINPRGRSDRLRAVGAAGDRQELGGADLGGGAGHTERADLPREDANGIADAGPADRTEDQVGGERLDLDSVAFAPDSAETLLDAEPSESNSVPLETAEARDLPDADGLPHTAVAGVVNDEPAAEAVVVEETHAAAVAEAALDAPSDVTDESPASLASELDPVDAAADSAATDPADAVDDQPVDTAASLDAEPEDIGPPPRLMEGFQVIDRPMAFEERRSLDFQTLPLLNQLISDRVAAESRGERYRPNLTEEQMLLLASYSGAALPGFEGLIEMPAIANVRRFSRLWRVAATKWTLDAADAPGPEELRSYGQQVDDAQDYELEVARPFLLKHALYSNAHVTDAFAAAMWQMAARFGFAKGNVLLPNSGVGTLSRVRPAELPAKITQIPNEPAGYEIATALHPEDVIVGGMIERVIVPGNYYDLAMAVSHDTTKTTKALGEKSQFVNDEVIYSEPDTPPLRRTEHLLYKTMQQVRPGGVGIFAVKMNDFMVNALSIRGAARARILRYSEPVSMLQVSGHLVRGMMKSCEDAVGWTNAELMQASDEPYLLISLRKREEPLSEAASVAAEAEVFGAQALEAMPVIGFLANEAVRALAGDLHANGISIYQDDGYQRLLAVGQESLREAITANLPEKIIRSEADLAEAAVGNNLVLADIVPPNARPPLLEGSYVLINNGLDVGILHRGEAVAFDCPRAQADVIRRMIPVRDAITDVLHIQRASSDDEQLREEQRRLSNAYEAFVRAHGALSLAANIEAFREDPALPQLLALEDFDHEKQTATRTEDFFSGRVVGKPTVILHAESAEEALALSLGRRGHVVPELMVALTGRPWEALSKDLAGKIFRDPLDNRWVTAAQYLSGPVRAKLATARIAAAIDPDLYGENVKCLEEAQPRNVDIESIDVTIGAPWLPVQDYVRFIGDFLGVETAAQSDAVEVTYDRGSASWRIRVDTAQCEQRRLIEYRTENKDVIDILNDTINGRSTKVLVDVEDRQPGLRGPDEEERVAGRRRKKDKPLKVVDHLQTAQAHMLQDRIRDAFQAWLIDNPHRAARIARIYNTKVNAYRERVYDGSYLRFETLSPLRPPMAHQVTAIARGIEDGYELLAHGVGSGKTMTQAAIGIESVRMGLAMKPVLTTPKPTCAQTAAEIIKFYPFAKVMVVESLSATNRDAQRRFVARASMENWDVIVMSHDAFKAIPLSAQAQVDLLRRDLAALDKERSLLSDNAFDNKVARIRKAIAKLEPRLAQERREGAEAYGFDAIGCDLLILDEAHTFKNLNPGTKMNVLGINVSSSGRAEDVDLKIKHVRTLNGGTRGVVLATATPLCNTIAEMYTMMSYVNPQVLRSMNIRHFDAWAATFGRVAALIEQKAAGDGFQIRDRFIRFQNIPEMVRAFRMIADIRTDADMPEIAALRPRLVNELVVSPRDNLDNAFLKTLEMRSTSIERKQKIWDRDSVIAIMGDLNRGMLDLRMVDHNLPENPESIAALAMQRMMDIWRQTTDVRGVQLVFCDQGIHGKNFSLYSDIREKLLLMGVPTDEIALINEYTKPQDIHRLKTRVNSGRIRFLLGSSARIGIGLNIQKKVVAMHHIDVPPRPDMLIQRIGRGHRPGNENEEVRNVVYAKHGQTRRFEILQHKAAAIDKAMRNPDAADRRFVEDLDVTMENIQAEITGNPLLREKVQVDAEMRRLDALRRGYHRNLAVYSREIERLTGTVDNLTRSTEARAEGIAAARLFIAEYEAAAAAHEAEETRLRQDVAAQFRAASDAASALRTFRRDIDARIKAEDREAHRQEQRRLKEQSLVESNASDDERENPAVAEISAETVANAPAASVSDLPDSDVQVPATASPDVLSEDTSEKQAARADVEIEKGQRTSGEGPALNSLDEQIADRLTKEERDHLDQLVEAAAVAARAHLDAKTQLSTHTDTPVRYPAELYVRPSDFSDPAAVLQPVNSAQAIAEKIESFMNRSSAFDKRSIPVGRIAGFELSYEPNLFSSKEDAPRGRDLFGESNAPGLSASMSFGTLVLKKGLAEFTCEASFSARANTVRLLNLMRKIPEQAAEIEERLVRAQEQLTALQTQAAIPFEFEHDFQRIQAERARIDAELLQNRNAGDDEADRRLVGLMWDVRFPGGRPVHPDQLAEWKPAQVGLDEAVDDAEADLAAAAAEGEAAYDRERDGQAIVADAIPEAEELDRPRHVA